MEREIGIGFLGLEHSHVWARADMLSQMDSVRLLGAYEAANEERASLFGRRYSVPLRSLDGILGDDRVDAVLVESWSSEMAAYAVRALEAGKAVLLEKPGAESPAEMRRVIEAAEGSGSLLQVGYMFRYLPLVRWARESIAAGLLGQVFSVRLHCSTPAPVAARPSVNQPNEIGGILCEIGCHMIDLGLHLFGLPRRVTALVAKYPALGEQHQFEDVAAATLEFEDRVGTFTINGWEANEWIETWEVAAFGPEGSLFLGVLPEQYRLYLREARGGFPKGWTAHRDSNFTPAFEVEPPDYVVRGPRPRPMFRYELEAFLARVRGEEREGAVTARQALNVLLVIEAIYRSAREGTAVTVQY